MTNSILTVPKNITPYEELPVSTITMVVYTNLFLDLFKIFHGVYVTKVDCQFTKKNKILDKKKLIAPYGSIYSMSWDIFVRGINTRKNVKRWCSYTCQAVKPDGTEINTVVEHLHKDPFFHDRYYIKFFCKMCNRYYSHQQLESIPHFLNQVSLNLSLGTHNIHIMIFKDNIKLANCKTDSDAAQVVMILFQDYLSLVDKSYAISGITNGKGQELGMCPPKFIRPGVGSYPRFLFSRSMKNLSITSNYQKDRNRLREVFSRPEYGCSVTFEISMNTSVNIKFPTQHPDNFIYYILEMEDNLEPYFTTSTENILKKRKKKINKKSSVGQNTTFIAFSSPEIILSGCYDEVMEPLYYRFMQILEDNREYIEEKCVAPREDLLTYLSRHANLLD